MRAGYLRAVCTCTESSHTYRLEPLQVIPSSQFCKRRHTYHLQRAYTMSTTLGFGSSGIERFLRLADCRGQTASALGRPLALVWATRRPRRRVARAFASGQWPH